MTPPVLAACLAEFTAYPYGLDELRSDLERFVILPGGSGGEPLFGLERP
jgi:hypothetical protein